MTNTSLFYLINHRRHRILDIFSYALSHLAFLIVLTSALLIYAAFYDLRNLSNIFIGFCLATILNITINKFILKNIFYIKRPILVLPHIHTIGVVPKNSAFPSTHLSTMTSLLFVFCFYERHFVIPAVVFLIILCWSRIYNGTHWPSDVLWGAIFGILFGLTAILVTPLLNNI